MLQRTADLRATNMRLTCSPMNAGILAVPDPLVWSSCCGRFTDLFGISGTGDARFSGSELLRRPYAACPVTWQTCKFSRTKRRNVVSTA